MGTKLTEFELEVLRGVLRDAAERGSIVIPSLSGVNASMLQAKLERMIYEGHARSKGYVQEDGSPDCFGGKHYPPCRSA